MLAIAASSVLAALSLMAFGTTAEASHGFVTFCHVPPGNPAAANTITTSEHGILVGHGFEVPGTPPGGAPTGHEGDFLGACTTAGPAPTPAPTPEPPAPSPEPPAPSPGPPAPSPQPPAAQETAAAPAPEPPAPSPAANVPLAQETPGQPDDELAFTGLDAWEIVILGVLLTASGVLLRRRLAQ